MFIRVPVITRRVFLGIGFGVTCVVASLQTGKHQSGLVHGRSKDWPLQHWRVGSKSSFLGMRTAQGKGADQELAFVAVDWLEFQIDGALMASNVFRAEGRDTSSRGGEMEGPSTVRYIPTDEGLPARAEVMLPRINGKLEIRIGVRGANPLAIHPQKICRPGNPWQRESSCRKKTSAFPSSALVGGF
jgi:hypothetical protein